MEKIMKFLRTGPGTIVLVATVALGIGLSIYFVIGMVKGDTPDDAHYTWYIDSVTLKAFRHKNAEGDMSPLTSPEGHPAYTAEACYWNADGTQKKTPTWVLLNRYIGKGSRTYCPDCGRLVVPHNPKPGPDSQPPPLEKGS